MTIYYKQILVISFLLFSAASLVADTLIIDKISNNQALDLPNRGLDKDAVEAQFGTPGERNGPIGEPPISNWVYDDFTVYFEHRHVITSVVHPQPVLIDDKNNGTSLGDS